MTRVVTLESVRRCVRERAATAEEVWLLARVEGLAGALERAADTFADMEKAHRLLARPLMAEACAIAGHDARAQLAALEAAP